MNKHEQYGTFECNLCGKVFHRKKELDGHLGSHRKGITLGNVKPKCKFCNTELVAGTNWPTWAVKQRNLICIKCKRKQNRDSYQKNKDSRKQKRIENKKESRKPSAKKTLKRKLSIKRKRI